MVVYNWIVVAQSKYPSPGLIPNRPSGRCKCSSKMAFSAADGDRHIDLGGPFGGFDEAEAGIHILRAGPRHRESGSHLLSSRLLISLVPHGIRRSAYAPSGATTIHAGAHLLPGTGEGLLSRSRPAVMAGRLAEWQRMTTRFCGLRLSCTM